MKMINKAHGSGKKLAVFLGTAAGVLLIGVIVFFVYFQVKTVEVMGSERYTEEEIKEMVLRGPLAANSALAPLLYSGEVEGVPFVEGFEVQQVNRSTIAISVLEKNPVGCVPFLDCYIYFDRSGRIVESSTMREERIPYFDGLEVARVALEEDLSMENESVLNTAVSLARIFEKNELIPDHILFDEQYQITLEYGEIQVELGPDSFLEDKMARLIAILPKIRGQKGILHMESVSAEVKTITFEKEMPVQDRTEEGLENQEEAVGDLAEGNETETDGTEMDGMEIDGMEIDGMETDGTEMDGTEIGGTETDETEIDGMETNGTGDTWEEGENY